jgi:hypothetical protein
MSNEICGRRWICRNVNKKCCDIRKKYGCKYYQSKEGNEEMKTRKGEKKDRQFEKIVDWNDKIIFFGLILLDLGIIFLLFDMQKSTGIVLCIVGIIAIFLSKDKTYWREIKSEK